MKLPIGKRALVAISMLRDYCLNPRHPGGRHKARVFLSTLRWGQPDAGILRIDLLAAASEAEAVQGESDSYGERYVIVFPLTRTGRTARVRSAWYRFRG